ncbi:acyl-CoA synthetase (AMP-forming)/AMP-acid ligase II [Rheinheimera sp. A13L]|uniref:AMP-binding protein n=1 Tax=Rheinheimera sp. A13L TaxID=506534 RepID=UPI0002125564|nr:AMP-binding protein [Rheinheimera sp. A13L]EGM78221.1 acyl-CoA synthetase (AMP-forming)/AMP-acid ligase II [Rheinheimera sp. A13L]
MSSFADRLEQFGEAIALRLPDGTNISYLELAKIVDQYSATLNKLLPEHFLLALRFSSTLSAVVAYLAALRSGKALLLLAPDLSDSHSLALVERLQIAAVIQSSGEIQLTGHQHLVRPDCALLLSTSGSSGSPKSVMLSLENIEANARAICAYLPIESTDTAITALPLHYSYGLSVLNSHLFKGASILLTEAPLMSKEFWQQTRDFHISSLHGVPFSYQLYRQLRLERMPRPALRYLTQAGGKLNSSLTDYVQQLASSLQKPVYLMYGQTEATARIAYLPPELIQQHADCIGVAIPEGELLLRDPVTKALIIDDLLEGELCYRGPNVMLGYANCADDLTSSSALTELNTGDLAERLPNGLYRIVGRLSRFLKIQGKRLQLDHLEQQLCALVDPVCCTGNDDLLVVAYTQQEPALAEQIQLLLREQLQLHPALYKVLQLPTLPRLSNGKADYQALLQLAMGSHHAG